MMKPKILTKVFVKFRIWITTNCRMGIGNNYILN